MPGLFHSSANHPKEAAASSAPNAAPGRRAHAARPTRSSAQPAISSAATRDGSRSKPPPNSFEVSSLIAPPEKAYAGSRRATAIERTPNASPATATAATVSLVRLTGQS